MDIVNQAAQKYQQQLAAQRAPDPLAQLAGQVGLRINSPEAEQKLRTMGAAVYQQAAQGAQAQQADAVDKATSAYKQSFFQGKV
jgi:predicted DsbA family dithiol-disulfide isomerase